MKAIENWSSRILSAWSKTVAGIVEVGSLLAQAKAALPHGAFQRMVEERLPFSTSTARMLMAVAENPQIANRDHGHALPASWRTLYELTKLTDEQWIEAEEAGLIRADVQRKEIAAFRSSRPGKPRLKVLVEPADRQPGEAVHELIDWFEQYIQRVPPEEYGVVVRVLRELARGGAAVVNLKDRDRIEALQMAADLVCEAPWTIQMVALLLRGDTEKEQALIEGELTFRDLWADLLAGRGLTV